MFASLISSLFGTVLSAGAIGGILGGLAMAAGTLPFDLEPATFVVVQAANATKKGAK